MLKKEYLILLGIIVFAWMNLYEYNTTSNLIYRTNRITHVTEFSRSHEWSELYQNPSVEQSPIIEEGEAAPAPALN